MRDAACAGMVRSVVVPLVTAIWAVVLCVLGVVFLPLGLGFVIYSTSGIAAVGTSLLALGLPLALVAWLLGSRVRAQRRRRRGGGRAFAKVVYARLHPMTRMGVLLTCTVTVRFVPAGAPWRSSSRRRCSCRRRTCSKPASGSRSCCDPRDPADFGAWRSRGRRVLSAQARRASLDAPEIRGFRLSEADEHLAHVGAAQQLDECVRRGAHAALDDRLAELHAAVADPGADLLGERAPTVVVVADDEPSQRQPLADGEADVADGGRGGRVVVGDRAAQGDAAVAPQRADRRLEVRAADVVEVDVDAARRGPAQLFEQRRGVIVKRG